MEGVVGNHGNDENQENVPPNVSTTNEVDDIKRVWIPPEHFKYIGPVPDKPTSMTLYQCLLGCKLKKDKAGNFKYHSVSNSTRYNARRHVQTIHDSEDNPVLAEFDSLVSAHDKNKQVSNIPPAPKQKKVKQIKTQEELDFWILNQLVVDVMPICSVEKTGFRELVSRLAAPNLVIKGRTFFTTLLQSQYLARKRALCAALEKATDVGVTLDLWSTRGKSYLGETIHWFDDTLNRQSACLTIQRVKGSHTYDVLGRIIEDIHVHFNILRKLTMATTDNGSNFLKAFRKFGTSKAPTNDQLSESDTDTECEEEDDFVYISLGDIFDANDSTNNSIALDEVNGDNDAVSTNGRTNPAPATIPPSLPPHTRCACHLLNLLSKVNVEKIKNQRFQTLRQSVEKKIMTLCSKQNSSSLNQELIEKHLPKLFVVKNDTRWNSLYNSLFRVVYFINNHHTGLTKVMEEFGVEAFRPLEITYIQEYVEVMRWVVDALDILQGEKNVGMGYLLPTIWVLKVELIQLRDESNITECKPLVRGLLSSINTRFGEMFKDNDLIIAALSDPRFKTSWISDAAELRQAEKLLNECYRKTLQNEDQSVNPTPVVAVQNDYGPSPNKRKKKNIMPG